MSLSLAQKEFRRRGVSASDIVVICGYSPWATPVKIWEQKIEPPEEEEVTEEQEQGNELEDTIIRWTGKRIERPVFHNTGDEAITFQSRKHELALATPDGLVFDVGIPETFDELRARIQEAQAVVEVKSPDRTVFDWVNPLEMPDGIPEYVLPQIHWQMGVLELDEAIVGSLVGKRLWTYSLQFDQEFFDLMLEQAERFWENYVLKRVPPPVDDSEDYSKYLAKRFPAHRGKVMDSIPEIDEVALRLKRARESIADLEKEARLARNLLEEFMGDAPGVKGPWGSISWKRSKDQITTDKKALIAWFEKNKPGELEKYRGTRQGSRVFRPNFK